MYPTKEEIMLKKNSAPKITFYLLVILNIENPVDARSTDGAKSRGVIMHMQLPKFLEGEVLFEQSPDNATIEGKTRRIFLPEEDVGEPLSEKDFLRAANLTDEDMFPKEGPDFAISNSGHFEGDIANVQRKGRNAIKDRRQGWPSGRIPYVISKQFSVRERSIIASAMLQYHAYTCIRFHARQGERDFIYIMKDKGCYSHVGREVGGQPVSLGNGCVYVGIVVHELMHVTGFWHEQSRTDRDNYITILWSNILPGTYSNFAKFTLQEIQHLGEPYDYGSVMHYGPTAFAKGPGLLTIVRKQGFLTAIGQRRGFSRTDVRKINKLYNCIS